MRRTLYNYADAKLSVTRAVRANGTVNGTGVDRLALATHGKCESALVVITTDTITDGSHAVTIQESDDNTAWNNVAAADLQGAAPTIVAADDDKVFQVGYTGSKRYIRPSVTTSGATTGGAFSAVVVWGFPDKAPISHT